MATQGDADIEQEIGFSFDPAEAERIAKQIATVIRKGFEQAFRGVEKDLGKILAGAAQSSGSRKLTDGFNDMGAAAQRADTRIEDLSADINAAIKRAEAFKVSLRAGGVDQNLFAAYDLALQDSIRSQRQLQDRREEIARDPELRKVLEGEARNRNQILRTETSNAVRILEAAHGREVTETQRAGALVLAETRLAGQKQIQDERQRSRTRIEILRFTFRQIQFIERQIAGAFKGAATLVVGGLRSIQAGAARIGQVFTRSNASLNDGLRGALLQRESAMARSFGRQTTEVRTEIGKQGAIISKFTAEASTGVVGALTGRSQIGSLLGGGLAIGGGFAAFQGLRNGIKIGGDFIQGLAVLQAQLRLTDTEIAGVRAQAIELGNDISLPGVSALDAAQAIQVLAKQFANLGTGALPAAQAAAKGVLQLARAAGVGAEEAARVVGSAVNVFGASASEAVVLADQVTNAMSNAAGVAFNDFADAFTQSASVVNLFIGPAQEATEATAEFNAAIAVLAKGGLVGSDAGTSLKQFFLQANRGTADAKAKLLEVVEAAGATGDVFFDSAGNARTLAASLDILRRGTKGLSDQARTTTFQKIFGSDATRAAAILVNESAESFDNLTAAIQRSGSAQAIAAAQNTGLRGALDALNSVIETQQIKTYEKYQAVLGKVILAFANLLNNFFEGVGVLGVLRDGLIGLSVAIGGLLVAAAAAQAVKLLAIALQLLLGPIAPIVLGIGLIGAAFNILVKRVPEVRQAVDRLGDAFGSALSIAVARGQQLLDAVARTIAAVLVPQLIRLALFLTVNLAGAFEAVFRFIFTTAIPAIRQLAAFVRDDLIPPMIEFGRVLYDRVVDGLRAVKDQAVDAFTTIRPLIQPALDGFQKLGEAIKAIATGDGFGGLGTALGIGLVAAVALAFTTALPGLGLLLAGVLTTALVVVGPGIASSLVNVGEAMVDILGPELAKVGDFIGSFFSGTAGTAGGAASKGVEGFLLGPFQDAAKALGFFLGNLASDPRLIQAIEKLIGLAALTGISFITGFFKGINSNLPQLFSLLGGQLQDGFTKAIKSAFANPFTFAKIIAAGLVARSVLNAFQRAGEAGAKATVLGFAKGAKTSAVNANSYLNGFFGGPTALEDAAGERARKANARMASEFSKINRDLVALGQVAIPLNPTGTDKASLDAARTALATIKSDLGEVGAAGTLARDRLSKGFQGIRDSLTDFAASQGGVGKAIGVTLGTSIVAGVGAALSGQQLGTADTKFGKGLGLAGIISAALIAGTAVGGGPQGVIVGGLVATAGLVSAAIARSGESAEEAAARVDAYAAALRNADSAGEELASITDLVSDTIFNQQDGLNDFGRRILTLAKFDIAAFTSAVLGGADALTALDKATPGLTRDQFDAAFKGANGYNDILRIVGDAQTEILAAQGREGERDFFLRNVPHDLINIAGGADAAAGSITRAGDAVDTFYDSFRPEDPFTHQIVDAAAAAEVAVKQNLTNIGLAIDELNRRRTDAIQGQIAGVTEQLQAARDAAGQALDNLLALVGEQFDSPFLESFDNLVGTLPNFGQEFADLINAGVTTDALTPAGKALRDLFRPFQEGFNGLVTTLINGGAKTVQDLQEGFGDVRLSIQNAELPEDSKRFLLNQLDSFLTNNNLEAALDDVLIKNEAVTSLLAELDALNAELKVTVVFDPAQIKAAANQLGLSVDLSGINLQAPPSITDALPGISRSEQTATNAAQAETRLASERNAARSAAALERLADQNAARRSPDTAEGLNIEQLNVFETTDARRSASEVVRSLRVLAGGPTGAVGGGRKSTSVGNVLATLGR